MARKRKRKKGLLRVKNKTVFLTIFFFLYMYLTYIQMLRNQVLYIGGSSTTGTGRVPYVLYPYCREVLYHI